MLTIGQIVENLINIKDTHKKELTSEEVDAINDACNILDHNFNRYDTKTEVVDNTIAKIRWCRDDIADALKEKGYLPSTANIDKVLRDISLKRSIQDSGIEAGWGPIYSRIYDLGDLGLEKEVVPDEAAEA